MFFFYIKFVSFRINHQYYIGFRSYYIRKILVWDIIKYSQRSSSFLRNYIVLQHSRIICLVIVFSKCVSSFILSVYVDDYLYVCRCFNTYKPYFIILFIAFPLVSFFVTFFCQSFSFVDFQKLENLFFAHFVWRIYCVLHMISKKAYNAYF